MFCRSAPPDTSARQFDLGVFGSERFSIGAVNFPRRLDFAWDVFEMQKCGLDFVRSRCLVSTDFFFLSYTFGE